MIVDLVTVLFEGFLTICIGVCTGFVMMAAACILLVTHPIWIIPYKFYKRKKDKENVEVA